ncbi:MAG: hypothetical protein SNH27_08025 [Rikenellaceae bacterium]
MYRKHIQKECEDRVSYAYVDLFNKAYKNQLHPQDLLLLEQHAALEDFKGKKHMMHGLLDDGLNSMSHINFINQSKDRYLVDDEFSFESIHIYAVDAESLLYQESVHEEKMLYLKIWENTYFLKQLTQLINLANGNPYDWELTIKIDGKHKKSDHIRNNIKQKLEKCDSQFLGIINEVYSQQIRNAIAHSQYCFIQNGIQYNNYQSDKYANIQAIGMEDWERRYTLTISLFCFFFRSLRAIHENYVAKTLANGNVIDIRGPKLYGNQIYECEYFDRGDRWIQKR